MQSEMDFEIEKSWESVLKDVLESEEFMSLVSFVKKEYQEKEVYPRPENIFRALSLTPIGDVKVVILGQDPYPRPDESDGLCFSISPGFRTPAGLRNIFKEIRNEYGEMCKAESEYGGDLSFWAGQGVSLLNTILTVEDGRPGSHKGIGWEVFTDEIIKAVSSRGEVVFLLWGAAARKKSSIIDEGINLVLTANHPSQPSRNATFAGNGHFLKANAYLKEHGKTEIVW